MATVPRRIIAIRMLGTFSIEVDGTTLPETAFASRRAVELVQLLALSDGHVAVSDRLVDALWPHLDATSGRANLRKAAHHARRALGHGDAIVLRGGRVHLCPDEVVHTDVAAARAAADAALASGDPDACAAAASAFTGDLLPGSPYEEWTLQPREELRRLHRRLLEHARRWRDLVAIDPLHEQAHQELIRDALAHGARADAIRWYEHLRTGLLRDLGVAPSPATRALYDRCVEGVLVDGGTVAGHDEELDRIDAVRHEVEGGARGCVVVRGPSEARAALGAGLARRADADGWCVPAPVTATRDGAYGTLVRVVESGLVSRPEALGTLDEHTRAVLRALTPLGGPAPALRGPNSRHQVIGAVRRLLVAVGDGAHVLVRIDDAHDADDASAEAIVHLASTSSPILVVLACAPDALHAVLDAELARLARAGGVHTIDLGGAPHVAVAPHVVALDPEARTALARLALAGPELDTATAVAMAGGIEEGALRALDAALASGVLVVAAGRYRFRDESVRLALAEAVAPHHHAGVHADAARRLAASGAPAATIARHWLAAGRPTDAVEWLLASARASMRASAFADARRDVATVLDHDAHHPEALRIRAEAMDAMGDVGTLAAYDAAIADADARDVDDLRAMRALAQIKMGDASGALAAIAGVQPRSVQGKLCEALTYSGAAALGFADPAMGTEKSAAARRLALESGDEASIVIASWAQAAAAHARGELRDSVLADLRDTKDLPHLAVRVFDGHLCFTQRFLYGSRPYDDVIAFADGLAAEALRLGAARGHAFGVQLRGEAELLSGRLDVAEVDLLEGGRLHRAIAGAVGEAHALQRLAEIEMLRGRHGRAANLLDEALDVARATDIGFHLLDRIYGTRITLATTVDPEGALVAVDEAEAAVRGPLETCPGCRITFAMPAGIACAQAGAIERAQAYERLNTYLAGVVMRLPAWDAALAELRGHLADATGDHAAAVAAFTVAADGFAQAGQPLDVARCRALAGTRRR